MTQTSREHRIRIKAFELWLAEGRPDNRGDANWILAETMIEREEEEEREGSARERKAEESETA